MPRLFEVQPSSVSQFLLRSNSVNFYGDYGDYMVDDFMGTWVNIQAICYHRLGQHIFSIISLE